MLPFWIGLFVSDVLIAQHIAGVYASFTVCVPIQSLDEAQRLLTALRQAERFTPLLTAAMTADLSQVIDLISNYFRNKLHENITLQ